MLEVVVLGKYQATYSVPNSLNHLHWMCFITCGKEVPRQEVCLDAHLPLMDFLYDRLMPVSPTTMETMELGKVSLLHSVYPAFSIV